VRPTRLLPLALLLGACAIGRRAENEPLDPACIAQLQPGVTTAREVVELLGAPVDVVQLGRRSAYMYRHKRETITGVILVVFNMFNQDERSDRLWVFFDENGVLTHDGATLAADRTRVATPFKDIYREDGKEPAEEAPPAGDDAS